MSREPLYWSVADGWVYADDTSQKRVDEKAKREHEWVGLTLNEAEEFYDKYTDRAELINAIDKFLEEKNT